jgi:glycosyltransferase involved in cell wall biosynthesis
MKLLFVLPEYGPDVRGGIATFYHHLIPSLVRGGCVVDVCVSAQSSVTAAATNQPGIQVLHLDPSRVNEAAVRFDHLKALPELRRILSVAFAVWEGCQRGRGYDVVEVTDWDLLYVPWLIAAGGPPVVVQLHASNGQVDYHDPFEGGELNGMVIRLLEAALLGRADELQSCGSSNASEWSCLLGRPVQHIWPAWTSIHEVKDDAASRIDVSNCGIVVGRIQYWKGPEVLCEAARLLGDKAPRLIWIGRDHPHQYLDQSLSAHLKETHPDVWGRLVVPVGEMSRASTALLQAAAKFVVVPSIWDTFNFTVVEAMSAGKVVICSEGAGAAQLIQHGDNGFRVPADNAAKLADVLGIVDTLNRTERSRIGRRAQETVQLELNADRIAAQRIERYKRLKAAPVAARGSHAWLESSFAARVGGPPFAFLKDVPLRDILRHVSRRIKDRLLAGSR